jgi:hypothetical protein
MEGVVMFETYDSIVLVCTDRGQHDRQVLAEVVPDRGRPDLYRGLVSAGLDPADYPAAVRVPEFGFAVNGTVTRVRAAAHTWKKRPAEIQRHSQTGELSVHLAHHPGCNRANYVPTGPMFTYAKDLSVLHNTRSPELDISYLPA